MAYRDFRLEDLKAKFGIRTDRRQLFQRQKTKPVAPSPWILETLTLNELMPKTTEKAVSELVIAPVLLEVVSKNRDLLTLFSGEDLTADRLRGLNGEVDFIMLKTPKALEMKAPIINVTEAKLNQAMERAISQTAAQMTGAWVYNQKHGENTDHIFGVITNGSAWLFLKLENDVITADTEEYSISNLPELLGTWQVVVDSFRKFPATGLLALNEPALLVRREEG